MIGAPALLEINTTALLENLHFFRSKVHKNCKIMAVVKAFAYGTDMVGLAKILQKNNIDYLAVAYVSEGVLLRKNGITCPILVLHPQLVNFKTAAKYDLELTIYNFESLFFLQKLASEINTTIQIHIKIDTQLHRLGFDAQEHAKILALLEKIYNVQIKGVFSHLAASEDLQERDFTEKQIRLFREVSKKFLKQYPCLIRHLCNTSGVLNFPAAHFDMVRVGIGLYGFDNTDDNQHQLKNVLSLYAPISQIKTVKKGESIGYNRGFFCTKDMKIGVVPIGHNDGISRLLGKDVGFFYVQNIPCKIVGNVCMDMVMIDLCEVKNCKVGDKVVIFNTQKHVNDLAAKAQTISYEILTGIGQRVQRTLCK